MRVTVFTAIFGNYERIRNPSKINKDVRYVLFTERERRNAGIWEVHTVPLVGSHAKTARHYKILASRYLQDADVTVWHGGWLQLIKDPMAAVAYLKENDIAMEPHLDRRCIYQEAAACINLGKVNEENAKRQMKAYRQDGFPKNYGLTSAFLIVRRNTPRIAEFEELWWEQIEKFTIRDQLSLMYCMWKLGLDYDKIPVSPSRNGLYRTHGHGK